MPSVKRNKSASKLAEKGECDVCSSCAAVVAPLPISCACCACRVT
jgi:hypothetical protein